MTVPNRFLPVNWIDGMKINKDHFIAQDNAWNASIQEAVGMSTSPSRFGILPSPEEGDENFNVKISVDNQNTLRVSVLACRAVTPGGVYVMLPTFKSSDRTQPDGVPATTFSFSEERNETKWWIVLMVNPFDKQAAGVPDLTENPPRFPFVVPTYSVQVISDSNYRNYATHPYALTIGKVFANGNIVRADNDYIPPCFAVSASADLVNLHAELDQFMTTLEVLCVQIVQKIYTRNQQNDISELVKFLCDRILLFLAPAITDLRWKMIHDSPVSLFACIASLARTMKNSIDLRIGSGKEEMLNYLSEWSELKQGEMDTMLSSLANIRYDNNDINKNITQITSFVKTVSRLFETLNKLEFIGKKKDSGIFVKEEVSLAMQQPEVRPARRRFLG